MPDSRPGTFSAHTQTSLRQWFKNPKKIRLLAEYMQSQHQEAPQPSIYIGYRDDGRIRGTGATFDNMSLQQITQTPTVILNPTPADQAVHVDEYMQNHTTFSLSFGAENAERITSPAVINDPAQAKGLVYIPGIHRAKKDSREYLDTTRHKSTQAILKEAFNRGMPIMAVCGGAWEVIHALGGDTVEVKDHSCSTGMPRLKSNGKVGFNKQVHRIRLSDEPTILRGAMQYEKYEKQNPLPPVNSVHWRAPDWKTLPDLLTVSAVSVYDPSLAPKNRQGREMVPEENSIEAFESRYGAPIIGVQWHPEAYTANTPDEAFPEQQREILKYMIKAGQTFLQKQAVNQELLQNNIKLKPVPCVQIGPKRRKIKPQPQYILAEIQRLALWQADYQERKENTIDLTLPDEEINIKPIKNPKFTRIKREIPPDFFTPKAPTNKGPL